MARIEQSIEVDVPVRTAYNQLTQFEEYPRFMEEVKEVRQLDDTHLHWRTRAGNLDMEWDAEITQQVPDRCIAWRNISGPRYEGKIELQPNREDRTTVILTMEYDPKHQVLAQHGDAAKAIAQRTEHDLAQFKKFIERLGRETGEWRGRVKNAQPMPAEASQAQASGDEVGKTVGRTANEQQEAERSAQPKPAAEAWPMLRTPWLPNFMQVWDEPMNLMRRMSEDMDRMLERFIGRSTVASNVGWTPPIEIAERDGEFIVCAELAGIRREDVHVEVRDNRLTIEGDRHPLPPQAPQEHRQSERAYGHFYRVVSLPSGADAEAASASLHDGMLEIKVPLTHGGRHGRRLDIQSP